MYPGRFSLHTDYESRPPLDAVKPPSGLWTGEIKSNVVEFEYRTTSRDEQCMSHDMPSGGRSVNIFPIHFSPAPHPFDGWGSWMLILALLSVASLAFFKPDEAQRYRTVLIITAIMGIAGLGIGCLLT